LKIVFASTRLAALRTSPLWQQQARHLRFDYDLLQVLAAMPAEAQLFAPRPGQKPRTAFLATLGEIITTAAA